MRLHRLDRSQHHFRVYNDTYAICCAPRTASEFDYGGRSSVARDGATYLLAPGELFRQTRCPVPETLRSLHLSVEVVRELAADLGVPEADLPLGVARIGGRDAFGTLMDLCRSLERSAPVLERESRLLGGLRLVLERVTTRPPRLPRGDHEPGAVCRAREVLEARFAERITLDDLARAAGVGKYHLLRCFKRRFGITPHAYLIRRRLTAGVRLLDQGWSPAAVAAELGFADQSHFTRCYREAFAVTPGVHVRLHHDLARLPSRSPSAAGSAVVPGAAHSLPGRTA